MIHLVLGTRPEIIKLSPIIRACQERRIDFRIVHTGQHYSHSMDRVFFEELELPSADFNLEVGSGTHAIQTGKILAGVEDVLVNNRPYIVLVQGDTNTVLAAALASSKLHIKVGHVEAGLRSFDRSMPEEINRVLADCISDYLYAPTPAARMNLGREGITKGVFETGNTVVDAVQQNLELARCKSKAMRTLSLSSNSFVLVTAHRQENVDIKERLEGIIEGVRSVSKETGLRALFPVHPRTRKMLGQFAIDTSGIEIAEPVGYLDFLMLESNAALVLTDSGGVQEEACILKVPCVTLRENTERPETITVGANVLAGTSSKKIDEQGLKMIDVPRRWRNPFGDGRAGERIVEHIEKTLEGIPKRDDNQTAQKSSCA